MKPVATDTELVEKIILSNEQAFTTLIDRYHHRLCVYAHKLIGSEEAEDLVQNVFMKIWVKRTKLNAEQNIKNFLYKAVFNEFIDAYRKNKKLEPLEQKYIKVLNDYVEHHSNDDLEFAIKVMQQEIDKLPEKSKEIFIMSKRQGLTNQEIADYLDISIKTVESHISKAYTILKTRIGKNMEILLFMLFGRASK
ncbi:RNA polymerase sigma-70 factor [Myroides sp. M-43]|uniref:RNA polymerase sigma factor n=1 Tax=Myroides oncorhynchi TaxID=2893756 RepID=UPI001E5A256C|nr:RNA polymerase sigma-70 factor [Myroides oncorhynchi]MCC9041965.1 RNA polymerase sigma-70 factor [Myroides oncorhynchi]